MDKIALFANICKQFEELTNTGICKINAFKDGQKKCLKLIEQEILEQYEGMKQGRRHGCKRSAATSSAAATSGIHEPPTRCRTRMTTRNQNMSFLTAMDQTIEEKCFTNRSVHMSTHSTIKINSSLEQSIEGAVAIATSTPDTVKAKPRRQRTKKHPKSRLSNAENEDVKTTPDTVKAKLKRQMEADSETSSGSDLFKKPTRRGAKNTNASQVTSVKDRVAAFEKLATPEKISRKDGKVNEEGEKNRATRSSRRNASRAPAAQRKDSSSRMKKTSREKNDENASQRIKETRTETRSSRSRTSRGTPLASASVESTGNAQESVVVKQTEDSISVDTECTITNTKPADLEVDSMKNKQTPGPGNTAGHRDTGKQHGLQLEGTISLDFGVKKSNATVSRRDEMDGYDKPPALEVSRPSKRKAEDVEVFVADKVTAANELLGACPDLEVNEAVQNSRRTRSGSRLVLRRSATGERPLNLLEKTYVVEPSAMGTSCQGGDVVLELVQPSTRTKPVVKSRVFDELGNNILTSDKAAKKSDEIEPPRPAKRTKIAAKETTVPVEPVLPEVTDTQGALLVIEEPVLQRAIQTKSVIGETSEVAFNGVETNLQKVLPSKVVREVIEDVSDGGEPFLQRTTRTKRVNKEMQEDQSNGLEPVLQRATRTKRVNKEVQEAISDGAEPVLQRATRTKRVNKEVQEAILDGAEPVLQRATRTKRINKEVQEDTADGAEPVLQRATRTKRINREIQEDTADGAEPVLHRATRTKRIIKEVQEAIWDGADPVLQRATRTKRINKEVQEDLLADGEPILLRATRTKSKQVDIKVPIVTVTAAAPTDTVMEFPVISSLQSNGRITRTKTKTKEQDIRHSGLSVLAKQSLKKAKRITLNKQTDKSALGDTTSSDSKMSTMKPKRPALLNSTNKMMKTPAAKYLIPNVKNRIGSSHSKLLNRHILPSKLTIECSNGKFKRQEINLNVPTPVIKPKRGDDLEEKIRQKNEKDEEARVKKQAAIEQRQKELKERNEIKRKKAVEQREKLEMEKHNMMVQTEKEKEEKIRLALLEREMKIKKDAKLKKFITEQKLAENEERRRQEEEARIAKLREMEAEQQRIALQKQREQERYERRLKEREAEKKAKEEYETQLRLEKAMAAKKAALEATAAKNAQANCRKIWVGYAARNADDLGLEDELTELESDDEDDMGNSANRAVPQWAQGVTKGHEAKFMEYINLNAMAAFMKCKETTPDIHRMFNMSPSRRIKRTSSAIWNTTHDASMELH